MQTKSIILLLVSYCVLIADVNACKCKNQTSLESFCNADWVSHLRVKLRITKQPMPENPLRKGLRNIKYLVHHIRLYKEPSEFANATMPIEILTPSEPPACGIVLEAGREYLLAGRVHNHTLTTALCGQVLSDDPGAMNYEDALEWNRVTDEFQKWLDEDKSEQCP